MCDINPINVVTKLATLIGEEMFEGPVPPINNEEVELAHSLKGKKRTAIVILVTVLQNGIHLIYFIPEIILRCMDKGNTFIETLSNLVFDASCDVNESVSFDECHEGDDGTMECDGEDGNENTPIPQNKRNEVLDFWNDCKRGGKKKMVNYAE